MVNIRLKNSRNFYFVYSLHDFIFKYIDLEAWEIRGVNINYIWTHSWAPKKIMLGEKCY